MQVIVLDEPTTSLHESTVENLLQYLLNIKNRCIIIIVSHDNRVENICDFLLEL